MVKGEINSYIRKEVPERLQRIPHSLNQEQEKLVIMVVQEMVQAILEEIQTPTADAKIEQELAKIKTVWKEFNKLLR